MYIEDFDYFEYTVVDQLIIRSYKSGELNDIYFSPGDGEISDAAGYFEPLNEYKYKDLDADEIDKYQSIVSDCDKEIGYYTYFPNALDTNSRNPIYFKGKPDEILTFLSKKKADFYYMF